MSWDRELEGGLPECRLSGSRRRATTTVLCGRQWESVYCGNCGADGGLVLADASPHVFYLCETCIGANGEPAGAVRVDEAVVRGR